MPTHLYCLHGVAVVAVVSMYWLRCMRPQLTLCGRPIWPDSTSAVLVDSEGDVAGCLGCRQHRLCPVHPLPLLPPAQHCQSFLCASLCLLFVLFWLQQQLLAAAAYPRFGIVLFRTWQAKASVHCGLTAFRKGPLRMLLESTSMH